MAQLTDDCFAFSGPLLPIDEVERILRERVMPVAETETVPLAAAYGRVMASDVAGADQPAAVRQFRGRRLRGAGRRSRPRRRDQACDHRARDRRPRGRAGARAPAPRSASSPAPRCRPAPTRCSCRRTCGARARPCWCRPASKPAPTGGWPARTCGPARCCCRRAGGFPPGTWRWRRRSGSRNCRCAGASGSRCSRPATRSSSPARRGRARRCSMPTAICWPG